MSNFINFKDDKFDKNKYREIIDIFENLLLAQTLSGVNVHCTLEPSTDFLSSKTHKISVWMGQGGGVDCKVPYLNFRIRCDQKKTTKAMFAIRIVDKSFNSKKMAANLKKLGFRAWDKTKSDDNHTYDIYCYDSPNEVKKAFEAFSKYM